jgi:DNA-binding beta-propeller fold protein YncE
MRKHVLQTVSIIALTAFATLPAMAAGSAYRLVKTIDLPGDKGGHGDWVAFDPDTDTVWLAQSPDHNVVVIDANTNTVKGVIAGISNGNVVTLTPNYAFMDDADGNLVTVVDKRTLQQIGTFKPQGKTPDSMVFDGKANRMYITADDSNDVTVVKAEPPFEQVAHFALQPAHAKDGPDVALLVATQDRIYQPDDNVLDVIDTKTNRVVAVWKPAVKGDTKSLVYDAKTKHLFMGTTDKKMLVLDAVSGHVVATIPLLGAADETTIDESARRAYVGDKAGVIEVIDLDKNALADTIASEKNVHTLAVNTKTHDIYVYRNESNKVDVFSKAAP